MKTNNLKGLSESLGKSRAYFSSIKNIYPENIELWNKLGQGDLKKGYYLYIENFEMMLNDVIDFWFLLKEERGLWTTFIREHIDYLNKSNDYYCRSLNNLLFAYRINAPTLTLYKNIENLHKVITKYKKTFLLEYDININRLEIA